MPFAKNYTNANDVVFDNTSTTGSTIFQLGTNTSATDFQIQNSTGVAQFTVQGDGASTFAGVATFSSEPVFSTGASIPADNQALTIGAGDDLSISHDGTNTTITSATGNLIVDNTLVTGSSIFRLGTDTSATNFLIQNNTGVAQFTVQGDGATLIASSSLSIGGIAYTFPDNNGDASQYLQTNGSGTLTWAAGGGGGGATTTGPLFAINSNVGSGFAGYLTERLQADYLTETADITGTTSGGSTTTVVSTTNLIQAVAEDIVGYTIKMTSGSSINDVREVILFDPATNTLTVNAAFTATIANTETFELYGKKFVGQMYDPNANALKHGYFRNGVAISSYVNEDVALHVGGEFKANSIATFNSGITIANEQSLTLGADSAITNNSGELIINNASDTGVTIIQLGTTTSNTGFQIIDSTSGNLFSIDGAGEASFTGIATFSAEPIFNGGISLPDNQSIIFGTGDDSSIKFNETDTIFASTAGNIVLQSSTTASQGVFIKLGDSDGSTNFSVRDSGGSNIFKIDSTPNIQMFDNNYATTFESNSVGHVSIVQTIYKSASNTIQSNSAVLTTGINTASYNSIMVESDIIANRTNSYAAQSFKLIAAFYRSNPAGNFTQLGSTDSLSMGSQDWTTDIIQSGGVDPSINVMVTGTNAYNILWKTSTKYTVNNL